MNADILPSMTTKQAVSLWHRLHSKRQQEIDPRQVITNEAKAEKELYIALCLRLTAEIVEVRIKE